MTALTRTHLNGWPGKGGLETRSGDTELMSSAVLGGGAWNSIWYSVSGKVAVFDRSYGTTPSPAATFGLMMYNTVVGFVSAPCGVKKFGAAMLI